MSITIKYIPSLLSIVKGKCIYDDFVYYQKWIIIILIFVSFGYQTKENMFHIFLRDRRAHVQRFFFVVKSYSWWILGTSSEKYVSFSTKRWWWSSTGSMSSWRVLPYVVIYILHKYYTWISGYGMELHNCSLQIRILSLEVNKLDKHSRRKYHFDLTSFTFE